ncbi:MAG TPA: hypothetical protein PLU72_04670 [Candidatus Ozemobacteraceae bacterium]|nr:hypothetical protein [Candidatus Ozemobacteraceae bacterium]HQG27555.1 hypothetical protein [Candidatus Ozemobacteraceae bacterium]
MKKMSLFLVVLAAFLFMAASAEAGSYTKQNHSLYLDGKVLVRFDQLLLGWTRDQKEIDRIRFKMTCLKGKAVLDNVEYVDAAVDGKEAVRWAKSQSPMNLDFSAKLGHMDRAHRVSIAQTTEFKVAPYDLKTAKVRFHIQASGRNYKVTWVPLTGEVHATW